MAISTRSSYSSWLADVRKQQAARTAQANKRNLAYDTGRKKEIAALASWKALKAHQPALIEQYQQKARQHQLNQTKQLQQYQQRLQLHRQNQMRGAQQHRASWLANDRSKFDAEQDILGALERNRRRMQIHEPMGGKNKDLMRRYQRQLDELEDWKYTPETYKPGSFGAMPAYSRTPFSTPAPRRTAFAGPRPAAMGAMPGVRAARTPAPGVARTIKPFTSGNLGTEHTAQYNKAFLDPYGQNVLGMKAGMNPLMKLMAQADDFYGVGDLSTGTQASRDYFGGNLIDYLNNPGRQKTGDLGGINESKDLQSFIKDRLGLQYRNYDDLKAAANRYYGHTRK